MHGRGDVQMAGGDQAEESHGEGSERRTPGCLAAAISTATATDATKEVAVRPMTKGRMRCRGSLKWLLLMGSRNRIDSGPATEAWGLGVTPGFRGGPSHTDRPASSTGISTIRAGAESVQPINERCRRRRSVRTSAEERGAREQTGRQ